MTRFYSHLTSTIMKPLGLPLAIFITLLIKPTFMVRILLLNVKSMLGITHRRC